MLSSSRTESNDLWRVSKCKAQFPKVGVLGNDHKFVVIGICPDHDIIGRFKPYVSDVDGFWIEVPQRLLEAGREVLIE